MSERNGEPESGDPFAREAETPAGADSPVPGEAAAAAPNGVRGWPGRLVAAYRSPGRPHTRQEAQRFSGIVVAAVALAYWFTQWPLPHLLSSHPDFNYYLVQPLIWGGIALLAGYGWQRLAGRPPFSRLLVGIALLAGIFHVAVLVIAGVLGSFGNSPIAGRLVNYPKNLWYITTLLAGAEVARAYLYWVWRPRFERLAFLGATLAFFAVAMPAAQWNPFGGVQEAFWAVGGRWLPALALGALATFLVSFGGVGPSFAYRFALLAFEWFSPLLPDLDWTALLLVGVTVPFASAWLVRSIYGDTAEGKERLPAPREKEAPTPKPRWRRWAGWVITLALAALIVLVMTGALGIRLVVVEGISMEPAYKRGDVAIVREGVDPASLQVNDVIQFRRGDFSVVHRIVTIEEGPDGLVFTTQGDNNEAPDDPISAADIDGKVVFLLPDVGHLKLWISGR